MHREQPFVPRESSFPVLCRYIDIVRETWIYLETIWKRAEKMIAGTLIKWNSLWKLGRIYANPYPQQTNTPRLFMGRRQIDRNPSPIQKCGHLCPHVLKIKQSSEGWWINPKMQAAHQKRNIWNTMGAKMITWQGFFISTSNSGKNNQDPAKDIRIPEKSMMIFLSELFLFFWCTHGDKHRW